MTTALSRRNDKSNSKQLISREACMYVLWMLRNHGGGQLQEKSVVRSDK